MFGNQVQRHPHTSSVEGRNWNQHRFVSQLFGYYFIQTILSWMEYSVSCTEHTNTNTHTHRCTHILGNIGWGCLRAAITPVNELFSAWCWLWQQNRGTCYLMCPLSLSGRTWMNLLYSFFSLPLFTSESWKHTLIFHHLMPFILAGSESKGNLFISLCTHISTLKTPPTVFGSLISLLLPCSLENAASYFYSGIHLFWNNLSLCCHSAYIMANKHSFFMIHNKHKYTRCLL